MNVDVDQLPPDWYCQLQYQLGVMGYKEGHLAWLTRGVDFGFVKVKFDADFYMHLAKKVTEFWKRYVLGDEEPSIQTVADGRAKYCTATQAKAYVADGDLVATVRKIKELAAQRQAIENQIDLLKVEVMERMEDCELLNDADGTLLATWKNRTSTRLNTSKLKNTPEARAKRLQAAAEYFRAHFGGRP